VSSAGNCSQRKCSHFTALFSDQWCTDESVLCAVTLQPFEYNITEKYTHKFMVQSIVVPDTALKQDMDNMVCIYFRIFLCIVLADEVLY